MPKHEVKFAVPPRPLAYKDIEFDVRKDGAKFGELRVSQGGVLWVPRDFTYGFRLTWSQLATFAETKGKKES